MLNESRRPDVTACLVVTTTFALLSVALRLASRKIGGTKLWWDDYLIILAMVCFHMYIQASLFAFPAELSQIITLGETANIATSKSCFSGPCGKIPQGVGIVNNHFK